MAGAWWSSAWPRTTPRASPWPSASAATGWSRPRTSSWSGCGDAPSGSQGSDPDLPGPGRAPGCRIHGGEGHGGFADRPQRRGKDQHAQLHKRPLSPRRGKHSPGRRRPSGRAGPCPDPARPVPDLPEHRPVSGAVGPGQPHGRPSRPYELRPSVRPVLFRPGQAPGDRPPPPGGGHHRFSGTFPPSPHPGGHAALRVQKRSSSAGPWPPSPS